MVSERKKRVLQIVFSFGHGGAEKLAMDIACTLDRRKFEPYLLGIYAGGLGETRLGASGVFHPHFERMGRAALEFELYNFIRKHHIDVVHVHGSFLLTRAVLPARFSGAKLVYTEHATYSLEKKWRLKYLTRLAAPFCHAISGVSNLVKEFLVKSIYVPEHKVRVIYNGINLDHFKQFNKRVDVHGLPHPSEEGILVGMVARLSEAKDHNTLLEAWQLVMRTGAQTKLVLVGKGELHDDLVKKANKLGISESVIFLGDREDIPSILSRLDLCVLSSKREGLPISILEYMAMGRPIIATSVGGIPEVVRHRENGYLIPPSNPQALADGICSFLKDMGPWMKLGEEGKKTVERSFTIGTTTQAYEKIYEGVLPG